MSFLWNKTSTDFTSFALQGAIFAVCSVNLLIGWILLPNETHDIRGCVQTSDWAVCTSCVDSARRVTNPLQLQPGRTEQRPLATRGVNCSETAALLWSLYVGAAAAARWFRPHQHLDWTAAPGVLEPRSSPTITGAVLVSFLWVHQASAAFSCVYTFIYSFC